MDSRAESWSLGQGNYKSNQGMEYGAKEVGEGRIKGNGEN